MTTEAIARRIVFRLFSQIAGGTLEVADPYGTARFGSPRPSPAEMPVRARVTVHDPRFYARVLRSGSVGLGEAYADGWWDTPDLAGVLRLAHRSLRRTHSARDHAHRLVRPIVDPIARLRSVDKTRDRQNVRAHYDLGNELFQHVLDDSMMYSCAVFESMDDTLAAASMAKVDRLARSMELGPEDRVLEIGTGWGGFAIRAARRFGCHVTTTTISHAQYEYARARVRDAGLDRLVTVRADDYRDVREKFDKVIAIEMIEAVDWREYGAFFEQCRHLLSDRGVLAMQAIVMPDASFDRAKRHTDFIKHAIFPGSCLPSVAALSAAARDHGGLSLAHLDDLGVHYAETLRRWRANMVDRRRELSEVGFDERFVRRWEFYFSYCEAAFDERYTTVTQLLYTTPGWVPRALAGRTTVPRHLASVART